MPKLSNRFGPLRDPAVKIIEENHRTHSAHEMVDLIWQRVYDGDLGKRKLAAKCYYYSRQHVPGEPTLSGR